jgi:hypothetical protein
MMTAGRVGWMAAVLVAAVLTGYGGNTTAPATITDSRDSTGYKTITVNSKIWLDPRTHTHSNGTYKIEVQMYYYERIDKYLVVECRVRDGIVINVNKIVAGANFNYMSTDTSELAGEHGVPLWECNYCK